MHPFRTAVEAKDHSAMVACLLLRGREDDTTMNIT